MLMVDDRQASLFTGIEQEFERLKVPTHIGRMECGDYAFLDVANHSLGIEAKTPKDLIASLRQKRLEMQMTLCQQSYNTVILLVVGMYEKEGELLAHYKKSEKSSFYRQFIEPNMGYRDFQATLDRLGELGVQVEWTASPASSLDTIAAIYHQRRQPASNHRLMSRPQVRRFVFENDQVSALRYLTKRLPAKLADSLIERYGSVWGVLNAPEEELLLFKGFGATLLENLKKGVGK